MENKSEQISKDIRHFENLKRNFSKIIEGLLAKDYTEEEIVAGVINYSFKNRKQNLIIGIGLVIISIVMFLYYIPVFINNGFYYELSSQGDFFRFNERIIKYGLSLSLILTGVLMIINRMYTSKLVKVSLLVIAVFFALTITTYHSLIAYITGGLAVILVSQIVLPGKTKNPKVQEILKNHLNPWKGSAVYIPIFFGITLLHWTPIDLVYVPNDGGGSIAKLGALDHILINLAAVITYLGFIVAVLLSLDTFKFKYTAYALGGISLIFPVLCLFHENFQNMLQPQ